MSRPQAPKFGLVDSQNLSSALKFRALALKFGKAKYGVL